MKKQLFYSVSVYAKYNPDDIQKIPYANGFLLRIPRELDPDSFFDKRGNQKREATDLITKLLCEALCANIHAAHQLKTYDSAEHLRYVMGYLEELFIANCSIEASFEDKLGFLNNL